MSEETEYFFLGLRGSRLNWLVILVAGLEFLLFSYDQGVMGGLLTLPSFTMVFPEICTTKACFEGLSASVRSTMSTTQGIAISSYNAGCFCGALLAAFVGDKLGRRKTIFVGCTLVTIGAILQFSAFDLPQFIVNRIVCGFGTGLNTATVPIWQAECLQPHRRGPVMAAQTSLVIAGVMISYWLDFGLSYAEPSQVAWRFPIAFQLVFSLFIIATIMFLPESPRWLMLKDKQKETTATINALYDLPRNDPLVSEQLSAIYKTVHVDADKNFMAMFSQGHLKKPPFVGLPIIYFLFPETWGRSLEEIDLIFTGSKNIFDAVRRSKTMERHFDKKDNLIEGSVADVEQMSGQSGEVVKGVDVQYVESTKM
ncbi:hypothetical protein QQS21_006777 [Conoideocrella luteorostrata]|uniref:Major facilitator superfamily (MFS) profile domain-containing protein n=1 Tax=Conoideocrella luteorostrata TaxID=1105319 RepID=A0AAJ0CMT5_9HYPO|nr:hypothetical protein QQS21_006777 [Conoideocrella luteorostrata]